LSKKHSYWRAKPALNNGAVWSWGVLAAVQTSDWYRFSELVDRRQAVGRGDIKVEQFKECLSMLISPLWLAPSKTQSRKRFFVTNPVRRVNAILTVYFVLLHLGAGLPQPSAFFLKDELALSVARSVWRCCLYSLIIKPVFGFYVRWSTTVQLLTKLYLVGATGAIPQ